MSLTVNSVTVAEPKIQAVQLRHVAGAFELSVLFQADVHAIRPSDNLARVLIVHSMSAVIRANGAQYELGQLFPAAPLTLRQQEYQRPSGAAFRLVMLPQQLGALEDFRAAGDLDFEFQLSAFGGDQKRGLNDTLEPLSPLLDV